MGQEIHPGSLGVTGVKRSFSPKMLILLQIAWYGHGSHTYWSARYHLPELWVKKFTRGHLGSQGSKGHFHQKCCFSFRLHGMAMGLVHIDQLDTHYQSYGLRNSPWVTWGHRGQKVIFTKKCYFSFKVHGLVMRLIHIDQLDTLYKSYGSRNSPGVTWGHRGQKVIFTKNAISPSDYMIGPWASYILIS